MTLADNAASSDSDLQLAYQQLLTLERFKSGFLARTSHELRSPINTIVSLHQLILEDLCESPQEEKAFIEQSKQAALKMLALFDRIAAVSKLDVGREPPKLKPVDLSFLIPEVEMLTALQAANQNVRYTVESPADELEITTDRRWLKNTLASLIQDSIAHTKTLRLLVEPSEESIDIIIECDRSTSQIQTELKTLEAALDLPTSDAPSLSREAAINYLDLETLKLSTGLVLATAQTALPAIKGDFIVEPAVGGGSRLICRFLNKP